MDDIIIGMQPCTSSPYCSVMTINDIQNLVQFETAQRHYLIQWILMTTSHWALSRRSLAKLNKLHSKMTPFTKTVNFPGGSELKDSIYFSPLTVSAIYFTKRAHSHRKSLYIIFSSPLGHILTNGCFCLEFYQHNCFYQYFIIIVIITIIVISIISIIVIIISLEW